MSSSAATPVTQADGRRAAQPWRPVMVLAFCLVTFRAVAPASEPVAPAEFESSPKLLISLVTDPLSAAVSHDGQLLAIGDPAGGVLLWDVDRARAVRRLKHHDGPVAAVAFDPLGTWLAAAGYDGRIVLWEYRTGRLVRALSGHEGRVVSLAFSPDGRQLASGSYDKTVRVWDLAEAEIEPLVLREHQSVVQSLAFSPDGTLLATGDMSGEIKLWSQNVSRERGTFETAAKEWTLSTTQTFDSSAPICSVGFSPDGGALAAGDARGNLKLWRLTADESEGEPIELSVNSVKAQGTAVTGICWTVGVQALAWAVGQPEGWTPTRSGLITAGRDGGVRVWVPAADQPLSMLDGHSDEITGMALLADGKRLLTVGRDRTVRLWRTKVPPTPRASVVELPDLRSWSLAFSPEGPSLLVGGVLREVPAGDEKTAAQSGSAAAVGGKSGRISAVDPSTGQLRRTYDGFPGSVDGIAVSPDGSHVAACGWKETVVLLWNARTGEQLHAFEGEVKVRCVQFSPDGRRLLAGCEDGNVKVWKTDSFELEKTIASGSQPVYDLAFSADGEKLAAAIGDWKTSEPGSVVVWSTAARVRRTSHVRRGSCRPAHRTDKDVRPTADWSERERIKQHERAVRSVKFLRDGTLAAGGEEGKIILCRESGAMLAPLVNSSGVRPIAISPDERYLAAGLHDGTISLWDLERGEVVQRYRAEDDVFALCFNTDGTVLFSVSGEARIEAWPVTGERTTEAAE